MKKLIAVVLAVVMVLTLGTTALAVPLSTPLTVDLIADGGEDGEQIVVGTLGVTFDGSDLNIVFTTVNGWEMDETHLYVDTQQPTKSAPGKFTYKHEDLGWVTSDPYSHPASDGTSYYIAAQAEVRQWQYYDEVAEVDVYRYESLWAEGNRIRPNKNWAMYFQVTAGSTIVTRR